MHQPSPFVLDAPIGSLVLTPSCVPYLRMMFYFEHVWVIRCGIISKNTFLDFDGLPQCFPVCVSWQDSAASLRLCRENSHAKMARKNNKRSARVQNHLLIILCECVGCSVTTFPTTFSTGKISCRKCCQLNNSQNNNHDPCSNVALNF